MSTSASPSLKSFDPHAVHYFTSASSSASSGSTNLNLHGVPTASYPSHIIIASTSPSYSQPPKSGSVPSQTTPLSLSAQSLPVPMQSPQPRPFVKGFAFGQVTPAAIKGQKKEKNAIFEPFDIKRSVTPELDAVLKKKNAQWGQWELEESLRK